MGTDLRWLTLPLVILAYFISEDMLPPGGAVATLRTFFAATGPIAGRNWAPSLGVVLVLASTAFVVYWALRALWNRQNVEWDGRNLSGGREPFGKCRRTILGDDVDQLYVSRNGQLRVIARAGKHLVMCSGDPASLRWVEQQLEQRLAIRDVAVADEWLPPHQYEVDVRECPGCGFRLPSAEITRQIEHIESLKGATRYDDGPRLVLRLRAGGAQQPFMIVWIATILCLFVGGPPFVDVSPVMWKPRLVFWVLFTGYVVTAHVINRLRVTIERGGELRFDWGPLRWPGYPRRYDARKVEQVYVVCNSGKYEYYSVEARLAGGGSARLCYVPDGLTGRYLEQELETYLGIVNEDIAEEWKG